ncbi:hemerythrin domain-containing protein [Nocardia acidivorans]|uniref:hemerythrin domain-containing protein n=1 Tax=Nocardia acidivorans TaxID=404580 RepID=UPI000832670A|nr:hemerythrin domain-containing protein [Nocardia acidivorans]
MADQPKEDVVTLLVAQHEQIRGLLNQVQATAGTAKRESFEELVRLLAIHESAEEEVVHPASRRAEVDKDIVAGRLHEENEAKQMLSQLYDLGVQHENFDTEFRAFAESVIEHAEMEEKEEFDQLRRRLSSDDRARLASAVRVAEAVAPTRPHPRAGESAVANIVAGPPLALFDRVRDAVRDWRHKIEGDK